MPAPRRAPPLPLLPLLPPLPPLPPRAWVGAQGRVGAFASAAPATRALYNPQGAVLGTSVR